RADTAPDALLTTQSPDEAAPLASRIVIIDHGRVIADGTPSELKTRAGRDVVEVHTAHAGELAAAATVLHALGVAEAVVDAATRRGAVAGGDRPHPPPAAGGAPRQPPRKGRGPPVP